MFELPISVKVLAVVSAILTFAAGILNGAALQRHLRLNVLADGSYGWMRAGILLLCVLGIGVFVGVMTTPTVHMHRTLAIASR